MIIAWPFEISWPTDKKSQEIKGRGRYNIFQFWTKLDLELCSA